MRMSPRRSQLKPIDRIHEFACEPDKLLPDQRNYVVAVSRFYLVLDANRRLLANLNAFLPFIEYIDQIERALEQCITWILDYVDDKFDFVDLPHPIIELALDLEEFLDSAPTLFQSLPTDVSEALEFVFEDTEELGQRLWERIRVAGYDMHSVLTGADTEVAALSPQERAAAKVQVLRR